jgi:hypothetical protein
MALWGNSKALPQRLKPNRKRALTARLKPCPDTKRFDENAQCLTLPAAQPKLVSMKIRYVVPIIFAALFGRLARLLVLLWLGLPHPWRLSKSRDLLT